MQQGLSADATLDLGPLDGPLLVFGGNYGNLEATAALLAAAQRLGIPPRRMICTGDLVAYCADPQATVDAIRARDIAVVMGNCEEALAADAEDCGCGFAEGSACADLSVAWFAATRRDVDLEAKRWMGGLPRRIAFTLRGRRFSVVHGAPRQINRFVFASTPWSEKAAEIAASGAEAVIGGHCGIPFTEQVGDRLWHNSGALGMPADDGTPRVWFSTLTPVGDALRVEHHALSYDHAAAAAKIRARGYPAPYAEALITGLWPSRDILPPRERGEHARARAPQPVSWRSSLDLAAD